MANVSYVEPVVLEGTLAIIVPITDADGVLVAPTGTPAFSIYNLNGDNVGNVMAGGTGTLAALPTPETGKMLLTHAITSANQYEVNGNYQVIGTYVVSSVEYPFLYVFTVT